MRNLPATVEYQQCKHHNSNHCCVGEFANKLIHILRTQKGSPSRPPSWWNAGEQADFDAWRQVQAMSAAASLGPMPHSKDIGYIPRRRGSSNTTHDEDEFEPTAAPALSFSLSFSLSFFYILSLPYLRHYCGRRLSPGMTNSFGQCPWSISRLPWHVEPGQPTTTMTMTMTTTTM